LVRGGCLGVLEVGSRAGERRLVVARIDADQHVARLDPLVVADRDVGDVARDLG
jgi:hypothetical protein